MRILFFCFAMLIAVGEAHAKKKVNCDVRSKNARHLRELRDVSKFTNGLVWPAPGELSDEFGPRLHPIKHVYHLHSGLDIRGVDGTPVLSAKAGVIKTSAGKCKVGAVRCNGGAGNLIEIDHKDGTVTRYLHLSKKCRLPKVGAKVATGQKVGCIGSTGGVTGPHLHFEVLKNGEYIDPATVLPKKG